jgi:hypothetical protein
MTDDELLAGFLDCSFPAADFHHREHVRVAWLMLEREPLLAALPSFVGGLQRFAAHHGATGLYHETITLAFLLLVNERRARIAQPHDFAHFEATNPDLMVFRGGILERYYPAAVLASDLAKRTFLMPPLGCSSTAAVSEVPR